MRAAILSSTADNPVRRAGVLAGLVAVSFATSARASIPEDGFADLVDQVEPAVVTIEVSKKASVQPMGFGGDPRAQEFFQRFFGMPGMGQQEAPPVQGAGSGFIIDVEGYIVTNNHVIDGADAVSVRVLDGREFNATVVGSDDKTDLALLKIEADELQSVAFGDSDQMRVGDWVVAIGNPFGLGGTTTAGIVSARGRDIQSGPYDDYLQIDAPINRGNSGGPVFNTDGEVVGVNTAIVSPNGGSVGIGFAIPANQVSEVVAELKSKGTVDRGWLGVTLQGLDDELAESLGLDSSDGALVTSVVPESPAEEAGIQVGDVIVAYDGQAIRDARELSRLVGGADAGDDVRLKVWRKDTFVKLRGVLGTPDSAVAAADAERNLEGLGFAVAPLTGDLRNQLGIDEDVDGALVTEVEPDSLAAKEGLRRGDVLLQVDRSPVSTARELEDILADARREGREAVPALIRRGDMQRFAVLPVA